MMKCDKCQLERETKGDRIPTGWKRHREQLWCGDCWRKSFILRAVTIPIVGPVDKEQWPAFREALNASWARVTELSNWAADEHYARDVRRNGEAKCPKMPNVYLYPEARERFGELPSQTTAAVLQSAQKKYRESRYEVVWTRGRALPTHRYPTPFPVPNQGWSVAIEQERPMLSCRIGDRRWELILRGGHEFRRQLVAIKQIISGEAVQGELAILRQRARPEDGRNGVSEHRQQFRITAKLVAWLPRQAKREASGELEVKTATDAILVAVDSKGERIWQEHAQHVRRWIAEHARNLQHWSDDSKAEQRPVPTFARRRELAVEKQRNRMKSAMSEIASHLANFAQRRGYASVRFDDTDKSFAPSFPWFVFRETLKNKCDALNIEFHASAAVVEGTAEDAREVVSGG